MMRRIIIFIFFLVLSLEVKAEKFYVVQRDRGSLGVILDGKLTGTIDNLGGLQHASIKYQAPFAYLLTRDGFLIQFDTRTDHETARIQTGDSSIGFVFAGEYIAVANYQPRNVVILNSALQQVRLFETGSRNVAVKFIGGKLVYSLMDGDTIAVHSAVPPFAPKKKFPTTAKMPFDGFDFQQFYVCGFFNSPALGVLDTATMEYREVPLEKAGSNPVLKIPHFGMWGIRGDRAFVPGVGEKEVLVLNLSTWRVEKTIPLPGNPVFVMVSPDQSLVAVNYSGAEENSLTLINPETQAVIKTAVVASRVMHFRFTKAGGDIVVSSYFENKVKWLDKEDLTERRSIDLTTPSGIFPVGGD